MKYAIASIFLFLPLMMFSQETMSFSHRKREKIKVEELPLTVKISLVDGSWYFGQIRTFNKDSLTLFTMDKTRSLRKAAKGKDYSQSQLDSLTWSVPTVIATNHIKRFSFYKPINPLMVVPWSMLTGVAAGVAVGLPGLEKGDYRTLRVVAGTVAVASLYSIYKLSRKTYRMKQWKILSE